MKNTIAKITCFAFTAAALIATPALCRADDATNTPAATPAPKKHATLPIKGKVAAVDAGAMTFTVGETTIAITSATKITKDGQPAVFSDITVGETVHGAYKKNAEGKCTATSVKIGAAKAKKAEKAAEAATNAPPAQ